MENFHMQINYQPTKRVYTPVGEKTRTKQSFVAECDVNNIMRQYEKTGVIDHFNTYHGDYGDFVDVDTYHASLNGIIAAQEAFGTIPAKIRARFNNDPATFLEYAQNPENMGELVKMGLARTTPAVAEPQPVNPQPPVTAPAAAHEPVAEPTEPAEAPKPHTRVTPT